MLTKASLASSQPATAVASEASTDPQTSSDSAQAAALSATAGAARAGPSSSSVPFSIATDGTPELAAAIEPQQAVSDGASVSTSHQHETGATDVATSAAASVSAKADSADEGDTNVRDLAASGSFSA